MGGGGQDHIDRSSVAVLHCSSVSVNTVEPQ